MNLVTAYPLWFVIFCLLLGGFYSLLLYFRTANAELPPWLHWVLATLRFSSVSIIAFLLLSPLVRKNSETIEKPLIILAQDNSESVLLTPDSLFYKERYPGVMEELKKKLEERYEVAMLSFGDRVGNGLKTDFREKRSDLSAVIAEAAIRYSNRNIGAMILATDGIYNAGTDPFYAAGKLSFPIYTVALGDTTFRKDIILKRVNVNKTAFLGDRFPMELLIEGNRCTGEKTTVRVSKGGKELFSRTVAFSGDRSFQRIVLDLDAAEKGLQRYSIVVESVAGETTPLNNRQDVFIEVTDTRERIAFLYASPHPDISAFRQALESSARFETSEYRIEDFHAPASEFDLIVLHQLPSLNGYNDIARIISQAGAVLFILGSQSDLNAFNALRTGFVIQSSKSGFTESTPSFNPDFSLFTLDNASAGIIRNFPPLSCPFGVYQMTPAAEVLFFQKIGTVASRMPLIAFAETGGKKTGFITGENLWRWRLSDFQQTGNHLVSDALLVKLVQYLSVKNDKSFFNVRTVARVAENESVEFQAEVFNDSYERITQPDVNLVITDEKGKTFPFLFGKSDNGYYLNAGTFPPGTYRYQASVKIGNKTHLKSGSFLVSVLNLESLVTIADHPLLYRIARSHNGEMIDPKSVASLADKIAAREDIRPVSYIHRHYSDLTGNLIVFLLILSLLTTEWFLRKRNGGY